jgi:3-oxoacyl-[acyl-carrier-protein] synthase II
MAGGTRVVVTGMGVISPLGLEVETMWGNLVAGKSGIGPITLYDTTGFDVHIAGEAHGFDPLQYMSAREARRIDRFTQFALAALEQALAQSQLNVQASNSFDIGTIIGSGTGGIATQTQVVEDLRLKGPRRINPFYATAVTPNAAAAHVALRTGARGPTLGVSSACASGADAIGQAFETIRRGHARAMLTGGFEANILPATMAAFDAVGALSHRNDIPSGASRPFDSSRDGFVTGEGGALLILEDLDFALERGAQPLAELASYAATSDAVHLTAPDPEGAGVARCMRLALQRAGLAPQDVSYINAHATGTQVGDPAEARAIRQFLDGHADRVPVSSTKSMTGHLIGGAGALEAVISIQALRTGTIPPTINLENPDPDCTLNHVAHRALQRQVEVVLSNSFGFGGHNAALVFRAFR